MTYTYVIMDLSPAAYDEIKRQMEAAGYGQAFHEDDGRVVIDMHGIAVAAAQPPPDAARGSLYPEVVFSNLEPHYSRHVAAMTAEGLHSKADIAAQLALRDQKLTDADARLATAERQRDAAIADMDRWIQSGLDDTGRIAALRQQLATAEQEVRKIKEQLSDADEAVAWWRRAHLNQRGALESAEQERDAARAEAAAVRKHSASALRDLEMSHADTLARLGKLPVRVSDWGLLGVGILDATGATIARIGGRLYEQSAYDRAHAIAAALNATLTRDAAALADPVAVAAERQRCVEMMRLEARRVSANGTTLAGPVPDGSRQLVVGILAALADRLAAAPQGEGKG